MIPARSEELRELRGTRNLPVTVAPFRAWRGLRGIVAQNPKFQLGGKVPTVTESSIDPDEEGKCRSKAGKTHVFVMKAAPVAYGWRSYT